MRLYRRMASRKSQIYSQDAERPLTLNTVHLQELVCWLGDIFRALKCRLLRHWYPEVYVISRTALR
jgi:hypothetical protein